MNKLYALICFCVLPFGNDGFGQDSIRVSVNQARKVYEAAAESRVIQERLDTCNAGIIHLQNQVRNCNAIVSEMQSTRTRQDKMISTYESKIIRVDSENATLLKENIYLQSKVKRQKKRNFIITVGSIVVSAIVTAIIIK